MASVLAVVIGGLYALGLYLLMRRSIVKLVIGLGILSHAANLLIFTVARVQRGELPLVEPGRLVLGEPHADPLPQALVLTAIVIGFGVQAFALVLLKRAYQTIGSDDMDAMNSTER